MTFRFLIRKKRGTFAHDTMRSNLMDSLSINIVLVDLTDIDDREQAACNK